MLNPRLLALLLGFLVASITSIFLWFTNQTVNVVFVGFISAFFATGVLTFLVLDYFIFEEVNKIYSTLQQLKFKGLNISKKQLNKEVNPLKKLNDELYFYADKKEREISNLKKAEQFRREFLADVSHELKTPIFAAQGYIHTLIDGAVNDEKVRDNFLAKAAKSLDGLDAIVRDLVALSQMESGEIRMYLQPINLEQTAIEVIERLEKKAKDRNVEIKITKTESDAPVMVKADPQRMFQVFTNLIENAVKYGREGGKVLVCFDEEKYMWKISIKDNGPGIANEHLNRIFERFYRIEKSRSKDMGGTGLGLAIVKHIIQGHKSKIQVASQIDKETTFSFKLEKAKI